VCGALTKERPGDAATICTAFCDETVVVLNSSKLADAVVVLPMCLATKAVDDGAFVIFGDFVGVFDPHHTRSGQRSLDG